jgi:hypothetical protein
LRAKRGNLVGGGDAVQATGLPLCFSARNDNWNASGYAAEKHSDGIDRSGVHMTTVETATLDQAATIGLPANTMTLETERP